jgi:hypothetical protein
VKLYEGQSQEESEHAQAHEAFVNDGIFNAFADLLDARILRLPTSSRDSSVSSSRRSERSESRHSDSDKSERSKSRQTDSGKLADGIRRFADALLTGVTAKGEVSKYSDQAQPKAKEGGKVKEEEKAKEEGRAKSKSRESATGGYSMERGGSHRGWPEGHPNHPSNKGKAPAVSKDKKSSPVVHQKPRDQDPDADGG